MPLPPKPPPSGKLIADIEQSSRDGAANQFQVWVDNDTDRTITPTRVTYTDGRFRTPLEATRLREIPSQARRGFQIAQPDRPACDSSATGGTVTVDYRVDGERRTATVPVSDEADVIERIASARCLELEIEQVAHLSWADEVTATGDGGKGSVGTMTLVIDTTGKPGPTLVIDSIAGNPVLSPGEHGVYDAALTITGDQPSQRVPVPVRPSRCDAHAFGESGSFNAFAFNVHIDGEPGQFVLRLGPTASVNAIDYAKASCGFLTSIGGGEG
ncbi:MAG TPA: hypothetical protein PLZ93_19455 [Nocardioides sp.]|uniref:hypothetical protein n=1 Tax=uncultured Nocardioides sp. TaxID=198441 RepID=UPI002604B41C|nr:hypothetical protein [uncultured Nocardioides sp.]HRD63507.1 hypothetical protein [Nocardioides sp.]HRI97806.1 hypothetical protein [Nocardioides sp.]HRK46183.1 hypothetical protein [Nocardioides sp.]